MFFVDFFNKRSQFTRLASHLRNESYIEIKIFNELLKYFLFDLTFSIFYWDL